MANKKNTGANTSVKPRPASPKRFKANDSKPSTTMTAPTKTNDWRNLRQAKHNPLNNVRGGGEYVGNHDQTTLYNAHRNNSIVKQIVEIPAQDSLSKGRTWGSGDDAEQPIVDKIIAEEARLNVNMKLIEGYIEARLFGGAAVLICTDDEDYSQPLDATKIPQEGIVGLTVLNRFNFSKIDINNVPSSPMFNEAMMFHLNAVTSNTGEKVKAQIHPTRMVVFHGERDLYPMGVRTQEQFWGDSSLKSRLKAIDDLGTAFDDLLQLLSAAKSPTLAIENLTGVIADANGEAKVQKQIDAFLEFNRNSGINLIDKSMEFKNNPYNFAGISDNIDQLIARIVAESDIPRTRLLGEQSKGLSNDGNGDAKIYYDRIKSEQELILRPALRILDTAILYSALGAVANPITYTWNPLMTRTSKERATEFVQYSAEIRELVDAELLDEGEGIRLITKLVANSDIGEV